MSDDAKIFCAMFLFGALIIGVICWHDVELARIKAGMVAK